MNESINWDEGSYQHSYTYDHFLDTTAGYHPEELSTSFLDTDVSKFRRTKHFFRT